MRVFLVHGMGRTPISMALLARRLRAGGHRPSAFGYFVTRDPLEKIAERLVAHVEETRREDDASEGFAVIGHSLGNVITRMALPSLPSLSRFVMLAPPNRPPVMAQSLSDNPVFRALTRDAGKKLVDEDFFAQLPLPSAPTLIVAGTRGPKLRWLPLADRPSDGVVGVDETRLQGVPHVEVPAIHTFIMNDREVARLTLRFLETGALMEPLGEAP